MAGYNDFSWLNSLQLSPGNIAPDTSALNVLPVINGAAPADSGSLLSGLGNWWNNSGIAGKTLGDGTRMQGWGAPALGALTGGINAYMGLQQLKLAKETLANNKAQFAANFDAQKKTTNAALSDRQAARVASNPTAYQSVDGYMKQYGI